MRQGRRGESLGWGASLGRRGASNAPEVLFHQIDGAEDAQGGGEHDGACQQYAKQDKQDAFLEIHIQDAGGEGACPGACAGNRNAHKQQQGPVESAPGLGFQLAAALFPLFQTPGANSSRAQ